MRQTPVADDVSVEHVLWSANAKQNDGKDKHAKDGDAQVEVELVAIHGGGHGLPQPYSRRPRLLGPSPMAPNGPAMIWAFFERQRR